MANPRVSIRYPRVASRVPGSFFGRLEASLLKGGAVIQLVRPIALQGSIASSAHVEPSASASDLLTGGSIYAEEIAMIHWRDTMIDRPESDGAAYVTGWTVSGLVVLGTIVAVWVLGI
ncbi:hypothetical protein V1279_003709 [Bradyrhizobium sp. AZCC 1610]|uniref:hypothetical protein n=1 Tax=Bradyrhizobium sp. AZCC 1610 TaxID=3117020 RepID=UPI002FF31767